MEDGNWVEDWSLEFAFLTTFLMGSRTAKFITSWATASRPGKIDERIWPTFGLTSILPVTDLRKMKRRPPLMATDNGVTKGLCLMGPKYRPLGQFLMIQSSHGNLHVWRWCCFCQI